VVIYREAVVGDGSELANFHLSREERETRVKYKREFPKYFTTECPATQTRRLKKSAEELPPESLSNKGL
jgi:hypothetical protein